MLKRPQVSFQRASAGRTDENGIPGMPLISGARIARDSSVWEPYGSRACISCHPLSKSVLVHTTCPGICFVAYGMCYASCIFCCWRSYIPFTIEVVELAAWLELPRHSKLTASVIAAPEVAEVSNDNPCELPSREPCQSRPMSEKNEQTPKL